MSGRIGIDLQVRSGLVESPARNILQVAKGTVPTTADSFNSATPAASSLYVDITPSSTSSKVYITTTFGIDSSGSNNAWASLYRTIGGSSSNIGDNGGTYDGHFYVNVITARTLVGASIVYLDSPSTTSSTRYTVYCATQGSAAEIRHDLQTSQIIAMEVAG
tara:strand:+ start:320 stop:805 length:486 start_codon:yes stop_codon:yes gene_type:complete